MTFSVRFWFRFSHFSLPINIAKTPSNAQRTATGIGDASAVLATSGADVCREYNCYWLPNMGASKRLSIVCCLAAARMGRSVFSGHGRRDYKLIR